MKKTTKITLLAVGTLAASACCGLDIGGSRLKGRPPETLIACGGGSVWLLSPDGKVEWRKDRCGNIHRAVKYGDKVYWSNGNLWVTDIPSKKTELFYSPAKSNGTYGFWITDEGTIVVSENATDYITEMKLGSKEVVTRFKGDPRGIDGKMPGAHHHYRMVQKTAAGTYLVCCSGANVVREYDAKGTLLWEQPTPALAFEAFRRANGNTLVSHLGAITEYTPDHKVAWRFSCEEAPELKLANLCGIYERANGNLVVGTYANGVEDGSRTTAFEVTRDKKIVWSYAPAGRRLSTMTVLPCTVEEPAWPAVTKEMRPWAYNWWMGCAADRAGLELQAKEFAEAGMGGYHVIPIYEAKEEKHPKVAFLSEEWTRLFNTAEETARARGLGVDLSMGCGWCFGGPWVSKENGGWHLARMWDGEKPKKADSRLLWEGKNGKGRRMALYSVPTGFKVKRPPESGKGLMIDPFSPDAMREHLKPFATALDRPGAVAPRAFYHDSYEYYGASWTPALFEAFKAKRGYDLRDHLSAFAGASGTKDEQLRLRHDYRETLSDLILDTFMIWSDWCRKRGIITRNEAHGSPSNWLDFYALSDIPETEMFNKDRDILVSKFASSAAHVKGTRLVASESCTWINEHFNASLEEVKGFLDLLFLSGVNHMYYHGCCYSPADAAWPGWCFYASLEMNPRNPIWRDAPILNAWITRVQSLAQTSEPDEDALIYWTLHDYWRNQRELSFGLGVSGKEWFANTAVGKTARRLYTEGAAFDFISDRQLIALAQQPKRKWNTIVIPDCETMPVETARSLAALAKKGYKIVFDGRRPADVPGLKDVEAGRAALAKALADIPGADMKNAVRREPFNAKAGLAYTRFRRGDYTLYYVVNMSDKTTQGVFRPTAKTVGAWLLDPMSGAIKPIAVKDGAVELALEKGESVWVWCTPSGGPRSVAAERARIASSTITLNGPWTLTPVCGGPDLEKGWPRTMQTLTSWSRNDDGTENPFCGTVCYRTTFMLDVDGARKGATLDLGRVCESARVSVNGVCAGVRIMPPYRVEIPAGMLKVGENVLEVEVTNVGANRIRDLDKRKVQWKIFSDINIVGRDYRPFDASKWPLRDSGLLGPVTLSLR